MSIDLLTVRKHINCDRVWLCRKMMGQFTRWQRNVLGAPAYRPFLMVQEKTVVLFCLRFYTTQALIVHTHIVEKKRKSTGLNGKIVKKNVRKVIIEGQSVVRM